MMSGSKGGKSKSVSSIYTNTLDTLSLNPRWQRYTQHLLRSCAMVLRSFVYIDDTQSLFLTFDLYIIVIDNNQ